MFVLFLYTVYVSIFNNGLFYQKKKRIYIYYMTKSKLFLDYRYGKVFSKDKKIVMYNNVYYSIQFLVKKKYMFVPILRYSFLFSFREPKKILYTLHLLHILKNKYHVRMLTLSNNQTYFFQATPSSQEAMYDFYIFETYIHKPTSDIYKKYAYLYYQTHLQCPTLSPKDLYLYVYLSMIHLQRKTIFKKDHVDIQEMFIGKFNSYFKLYLFLKEKGYISAFYQKIPILERHCRHFQEKVQSYRTRPRIHQEFEKAVSEIGDTPSLLLDMEKYTSKSIDTQKIKRTFLKQVSN